LLIRKELLAGDPLYSHPPFDVESRIVQVELRRLVIASVYVPNGGQDYPPKLNFLTRLTAWARQLHPEGRELLLCCDSNIALPERPGGGGVDAGLGPGCALPRHITRPIGKRAIRAGVGDPLVASHEPVRTRHAGRRGAQHHKPTHRASAAGGYAKRLLRLSTT